MEGNRARRRIPVVEGGLVELVVVVLLDVLLALAPNGRHGVEGLELLVILVLGSVVLGSILGLGQLATLGDHHADWVTYVVRVTCNKVAQAPLAQISVKALLGFLILARRLFGLVTQRQYDVGTMGGTLLVCLLDGVALGTVGLPHVGLVGTKCTGHDAHLLGNHERRIEAHAELTDDVDFGTLCLAVCLFELLGAGMRDGA